MPQASTVSAPLAVADARAWVRALRCREWSKNLLVLAIPAAAAALGHTVVAGRAALALMILCLLSSAVYLIDDVVDLDEDRSDPVRRLHPIAAGTIEPAEAMIAAGGCLFVALISAAVVDLRLLIVALLYASLNLIHTGWASRVPLADLSTVAGCFLLRTLAGGAATGIPISPWLVAVVALAALVVAAGKRYTSVIDAAARNQHAVLRSYDPQALRRIGCVACGAALIAYAVWAIQSGAGAVSLRGLSLMPFAAALIRYLTLADRGEGKAPERLLLTDRPLQLAAALWLGLFLAGA